MHILICNERLLFRFGVDRVLVLLGRGLKERGHTVSLMANQYDPVSVKSFAAQTIKVPSNDNDYLNMNEHVTDWLQQSWHNYFIKKIPDVVLIGGWPFFSAIPFFKKMGSKVIFIDCGAVPLQGYSGGFLTTQHKLRNLRKQYLKETDLITPISDFIANSQSKIDSDMKVPVKTILLGADHMEMSIWKADKTGDQNAVNFALDLKRKGRQTILNLGRWENNCYKNSEAIFDLARKLKNVSIDCAFLVLAKAKDINPPPDLTDTIFAIGFPDDNELKNLMNHVDLGVSVSLWEGFNLPLAEMQWLDRPVLVFNIGAHPEVVLHPWYLCKDPEEMINKTSKILSGQGLDNKKRNEGIENFRTNFRWEKFIQNYCNIFQDDTIGQNKISDTCDKEITVFIDVTNACRDSGNSGVIRVTRRLCRELQTYLDPVFVVWDNNLETYVLPDNNEYKILGSFNGPVLSQKHLVSKHESRLLLEDFLQKLKDSQTWLLFFETIQETVACKARKLAKKHGLHLGAIFHDAIPLLHPEFVLDENIRNNHASYMKGLAECDIILPNSNFSGQSLKDFWQKEEINGCTIIPNLLPGEFGGVKRVKSFHSQINSEIRILCVSTLEPRKNHTRLIKACLKIKKEHPDLKWKITLIGNRYEGAFDLAEYIESVTKEHSEIEWLGIVDDETLHNAYLRSDFTVYASVIEGFGMPILESLWHGTPCLCHREGVMSELAKDGGCYTADVKDTRSLAEAIYKLITENELRLNLTQEAIKRSIKTWREYTKEFIEILQNQTSRISPHSISPEKIFPRSWKEILYPECLLENWQMNHSERLALTALLARHRPRCSIEIGTFKGGSLSLISQYSDFVFSIDIDPDVANKFSHLNNVSFLTGYSKTILPLLLNELDNQQIAVDFILIDGDHSTEGINRDINITLDYTPKNSLFVLAHDSFNPECRRGMVDADWSKSPYLDFVDLDFVSGRLIEHGGDGHGELWGGLALFYMTPEKNNAKTTIQKSAEIMHNRLKNI